MAAFGNGWYGFALDGVAAVAERLSILQARCREVDRDVDDLRVAVALREPARGDVTALADLGVDELVIVDTPPPEKALAAGWVSRLADRWLPAAR